MLFNLRDLIELKYILTNWLKNFSYSIFCGKILGSLVAGALACGAGDGGSSHADYSTAFKSARSFFTDCSPSVHFPSRRNKPATLRVDHDLAVVLVPATSPLCSLLPQVRKSAAFCNFAQTVLMARSNLWPAVAALRNSMQVYTYCSSAQTHSKALWNLIFLLFVDCSLFKFLVIN